LSRAADAGDTASAGCSHEGPDFCHFDMTQAPDFGAALRNALAQITGQIISCSYDLPTPPPGEELDLTKVNVVHTPGDGEPVLIPQTGDGSCSEGWRYQNGTIELCESTCQRVRAARVAVRLCNAAGSGVLKFFDCTRGCPVKKTGT
jgi:hypothetical protein